MDERDYPTEAYYEGDGKLWWDRTASDGPRGATGAIPRVASYLTWNVLLDETFTTAQLRKVLGINDEHFQRRLRGLRELGWRYRTSKEDPSLGEECVLEQYGWWPGSDAPRPAKTAISDAVRREVFLRDGSRCVICGLAAGEAYEDGSRATMTLGHVKANALGGANAPENLRTECRRCNESVRWNTGSTTDPEAVVVAVRELPLADRRQLRSWIATGQRTRSRLDKVYDQVRLGGPEVQALVSEYLSSLS